MSRRNRLVFALFLALFAPMAHSQNCHEASILSPAPFMGNNDEIFKLDDGSLWQVKFSYEYLFEYYPRVIICPDRKQLHINGKRINVEMVGSSAPPVTRERHATPANSASPTQLLDKKYPNWHDMVRAQKFKDWLATQPDNIKRLAGSENQKDAIKLLDIYLGISQ